MAQLGGLNRQEKESAMTRILLAAATVANLFAAPALAQNPDSGSRTIVETPYVQAAAHPRAAKRAKPSNAFAQSPGVQSPDALYGHRWPGAHYDANGYYIDPNSPGRW
jgi:hypothetical protein